ncbi:three-Cys-motif partner protein TcmP [Sphingopyxis sp.]|uniref:three-Cys-motif partner protein TcmP n=1 Tax=Sphingopyxis sp. TaxID=1908224 RepID=UPI003BAD83D1
MAKKHYGWELGKELPKLGAHSLAKHQVFEQYTERYIEILSPNPAKTELNLSIVDGFCGGGAYDLNGETVPGSPMLLLGAVQRAEARLAAVRKNGFDVRDDYFFIDRKKPHIDFLHDRILQSEHAPELGRSIHLRNDRFENQALPIINAIKAKGSSHRSLFFLDQYGWSDVTFATVRTIFQQLKNPEVIITFSVDSLIDYLTDQTALMRSGQAIELDPSLGEALAAMKTEDGQRSVIQGFLYRHILNNTGARYYTPFFIRSPDSHRSYWLLHLSQHARARDAMAQLHWELQNTFVHPGKAGFNALGFDPSIDMNQPRLEFDFGSNARQDSLNTAIEQLPGLFYDDAVRLGEPVTIAKLFAARCNETPLTLDLVAEAVRRLRDDHMELEVFTKDGAPRLRAMKLSPKDIVRVPMQKSFLHAAATTRRRT